jgi:hypothetical protein
VIDTLPGGCAHRDVTHEAHRPVVETLADVDDLAVGVGIGVGERAFEGRIRGVHDEDERVFVVETPLTAEPLVSSALRVEAVGGEGVAVRADGSALVVVAAQRPLRFVVIGGMGPEIGDTAGVQVVVDHVEECLVAEASVTGDGEDVERRVEGRELGEESGSRVLLTGVGGHEVIEQDDAEAALRIGDLKGEAAIPIVGLAWFAIR